MRSVIAFVQPFMAEKVLHALRGIDGLPGSGRPVVSRRDAVSRAAASATAR